MPPSRRRVPRDFELDGISEFTHPFLSHSFTCYINKPRHATHDHLTCCLSLYSVYNPSSRRSYLSTTLRVCNELLNSIVGGRVEWLMLETIIQSFDPPSFDCDFRQRAKPKSGERPGFNSHVGNKESLAMRVSKKHLTTELLW